MIFVRALIKPYVAGGCDETLFLEQRINSSKDDIMWVGFETQYICDNVMCVKGTFFFSDLFFLVSFFTMSRPVSKSASSEDNFEDCEEVCEEVKIWISWSEQLW